MTSKEHLDNILIYNNLSESYFRFEISIKKNNKFI